MIIGSPIVIFSQINKQTAASLLSKLTLKEKLRLIVGGKFTDDQTLNPVLDRVPGAAGRTYPIVRLGLPVVTLSDGPAGVRINPYRGKDSAQTYFATGFPIATLLASSWDTVLVHQVGEAFGKEAKEYGVDVLLAPALNIQRNPLNGRNFEYYSEDPFMAGSMAAAMINGIQSNGIGTSIKHFVANNQETDRTKLNEIISERALRELYLKAFEVALKKSEPWTLMNSYNKVNGVYTSENEDLNTTILRDEWNYKGLVMTDWHGGKHATRQIIAGTDLLMPGEPWQLENLESAVKHDSLSMKMIDRSVTNILNLILKSPAYTHYKYSNKPDLKANAMISRRAASEGMILLKNEHNVLPLKNGFKIALLGNASYQTIANGTGSGEVHKPYIISINEGLKNAGYSVDEKSMTETPADLASKDDIAIITIGRNAGEGHDRKVEDDFLLKKEERKQIQNIANAFHAKNKKVIVLLNIGGIIEMASWQDEVDAILLTWQPGEEAGNAIADIISGRVDPSGRLAITIPEKYEDEPSAQNFPGTAFPKGARNLILGNLTTFREVDYKEGIFVGYRYFNTFDIKPAYPFGFGLSYTKFRFSDMAVDTSTPDKQIKVTVSIKNTGNTAGKEVVQLYLSAPRGDVIKPSEELKAFAKTKLLSPGESQSVTLSLSPDQLASFVPQRSAWIADKGVYTIKIGASSLDIKQQVTFDLPKEIIVQKTHPIHYPEDVSALQ